MAILAVNAGSSSLKLSWFDVRGPRCDRLLDARISNIRTEPALEIVADGKKQRIACPSVKNIDDAFTFAMNQVKQLKSPPPHLQAIGHRVVHGGERYLNSVVITPEVITELEKLSTLAPLHNPACVEGIKGALHYFGNSVLNIAMFDTAFHQSIPPEASLYAIPYELSKKYAIKRYGFHGIAHQYDWKAYKRYCFDAPKEARIITIHLGSGCSMSAIRDGRCLDTSMGFTPAEGLVMATRAGDIDASIVEFLCRQQSISAEEVLNILNFQSGLKGVSQLTPDMKELLQQAPNHPQARLAIDLFCYRIRKYLGAYLAVLEGADAVIFSGGIGENSPEIRHRLIQGLGWLNVHLDDRENGFAKGLSPGMVQKISSDRSSIAVYVVAADENALIAQDAYRLSERETGA